MWVKDLFMMTDGEGSLIFLPFEGGFFNQFFIDMEILGIIRNKYCALIKKKQEEEMKKIGK